MSIEKAHLTRNYLLDIFRGVAAIIVMLYHFGQMRQTQNMYDILISYGWLGVPIFFIISGYSISFAIAQLPSFKGFVLKRLFRIYPAYWLSLIVVFTIVAMQKIITGTNSIVEIPKNLAAIFNTAFSLYNPLTQTAHTNWVYWTLIYELFFYLSFAIALFLKPPQRIYYYLLLIIFSLAYRYYQPINLLFFFKLIGYFGLGVGVFYVKELKNKWAWALLFLSLLSCYLNKQFASQFEHKLQLNMAIATAIAFVIIIFALSKFFTRKSFLTTLGDLSYSIYLFHIPIGIYLYSLLKFEITSTNIFNIFILDTSRIILVILFSYFVFKFIEKPCMNYAKRFV